MRRHIEEFRHARQAASKTVLNQRLARIVRRAMQVLRTLRCHPAFALAASLLCTSAPAQSELSPEHAVLRTDLEHSPNWVRQASCASRLAAAKVDDPAVLAALLRHITKSQIPALRCYCLDAYKTLCPTAARELIAAAARGDFAELEFSVDALERLGDQATELLIEQVRSNGPAAKTAEGVFLRRGWLDVPELERAGLGELAERSLFTAALHRCHGLEAPSNVTARMSRQPVRPTQLPVIECLFGVGHGSGLTLYRATEVEQGLRITEIVLLEPREEPSVAEVHSTVLPREEALAMTRQLAVLPLVEFARVETPDESFSWWSSGNFVAWTRITTGEELMFDAAFCDFPTDDNVKERFVPEVASQVLFDSLRASKWAAAELTDADRAFVARSVERLPKSQSWWTKKRLDRLRELLEPK